MEAKELLRQTIDKERNFRTREFLAPYNKRSRTAIVHLDNLKYKFRIHKHKGEGIGRFVPTDPLNASFKEDASWEVAHKYLSLFTPINLILVYEIEGGWVGYPMSEESTKKRLGFVCPVEVYNTTDAERFDCITSRFDGKNFWYDDIFASADLGKSLAIREAFDVALSAKLMKEKLSNIIGVTPEDRKSFDLAIESWEYYKTVTTKDKLAETLAASGAKLHSYVVRGKNLEVRWASKSGEKYYSTVSKESFDVVCAGICVDGDDLKFHLKDLPYIVAEGEAEHLIYRTMGRNIDFDGEHWDDED